MHIYKTCQIICIVLCLMWSILQCSFILSKAIVNYPVVPMKWKIWVKSSGTTSNHNKANPCRFLLMKCISHYCDVMINTIASQITTLTFVYLTVNSGTDQRKHQSSASLAFVRGIHRRPMNSPHKGPVTRKMFPFDDVIMSRFTLIKQTVVVSGDSFTNTD